MCPAGRSLNLYKSVDYTSNTSIYSTAISTSHRPHHAQVVTLFSTRRLHFASFKNKVIKSFLVQVLVDPTSANLHFWTNTEVNALYSLAQGERKETLSSEACAEADTVW